MSLGEGKYCHGADISPDAKFPTSGNSDIPPSPTVENPGQVYPKSDPHAARLGTIPGTGGRSNSSQTSLRVGNPFLMREAFSKIDQALMNAIDMLEREESSVGFYRSDEEDENGLLKRFMQWREELDEIRAGAGERSPETSKSRSSSRLPHEHEGGMFTD